MPSLFSNTSVGLAKFFNNRRPPSFMERIRDGLSQLGRDLDEALQRLHTQHS